MLLDRGHLVREGSVYRLAGPIEALEVPETLHALIAARLDGLSTRSGGSSRTAPCSARPSRAAPSGALRARRRPLEPVLAALVRKEVLVDPGRPALAGARPVRVPAGPVRRVAYEMLSMRDRRDAPPRGCRLPRAELADDDEIVEVLASHYLDAYTVGAGCRRRRRRQAAGARAARARPASARRRSARRRGPALLRPRRRAHRGGRGRGRPAGAGGRDGDAGRRAGCRGRACHPRTRAVPGGGCARPAARVLIIRSGSIRCRDARPGARSEWSEPTTSFARAGGRDFATLAARLAGALDIRQRRDRCAELVEQTLDIAEAPGCRGCSRTR